MFDFLEQFVQLVGGRGGRHASWGAEKLGKSRPSSLPLLGSCDRQIQRHTCILTSVDNHPDLTRTFDDIAGHLQTLVDRAVPTANRIAKVIRVGGLVGLVGGVLGATALALPGFGFTESWGFFLVLLVIAVACAALVFRWSMHLRSWSGEVRQVVAHLHDLPSPGKMADELRGGMGSLAKHGSDAEGGRASVVALVRAGTSLRDQLVNMPGMAEKAKDIFVKLTGPFRPPLLAVRLGLLVGGLAMIVIGPLLAVIAWIT